MLLMTTSLLWRFDRPHFTNYRLKTVERKVSGAIAYFLKNIEFAEKLKKSQNDLNKEPNIFIDSSQEYLFR